MKFFGGWSKPSDQLDHGLGTLWSTIQSGIFLHLLLRFLQTAIWHLAVVLPIYATV